MDIINNLSGWIFFNWWKKSVDTQEGIQQSVPQLEGAPQYESAQQSVLLLEGAPQYESAQQSVLLLEGAPQYESAQQSVLLLEGASESSNQYSDVTLAEPGADYVNPFSERTLSASGLQSLETPAEPDSVSRSDIDQSDPAEDVRTVESVLLNSTRTVPDATEGSGLISEKPVSEKLLESRTEPEDLKTLTPMDSRDCIQVAQHQTPNYSAKGPKIPMLPGERPLTSSKTVDGYAIVTNFRFCVCERRSLINVPLMMVTELFVIEATRRLRIGCKDASTYSCTFATAEDCSQCLSVLRDWTGLPSSSEVLFAYKFYQAALQKERPAISLMPEDVHLRLCKPGDDVYKYSFDAEIKRLGFDTSQKKIWRISQANQKYEYCPTYPREHILPATFDDDKLKGSLEFRAMKRFPSVVWRDRTSGVVIIRSSQPLSSFLGFSLGYFQNQMDICLLEEIVNTCNRERDILAQEELCRTGMPMLEQDGGSHSRGDDLRTNRKLAIVDCRSLAGVWGNSFKGGGTEDEVIYKCNIIHLDLANIHNVRDSFNKLRALCHTYVEGTFYKALSGCMWLSYVSALLRGANIVVELIHNKKRPVLVHCSDGWDRTSQIVSLSEIMLDPYYRTFDGFQVVVEREWLHFGHKFGERGGHDPNCTDTNQVSPIFLQFLDCVYQLTLQNPAEFQFSEAYLIKLLQHSQACLFGNFLHNCQKEREASGQQTASVWSLLRPDNINLVNLLYKPTSKVLTARFSEHEVVLWKTVYMAGLSPLPHTDFYLDSASGGGGGEDGVPVEGLPRSKSMDDLSKATLDSGRRNSVPSIGQCPELAAATSVSSESQSSQQEEVVNTSEENGREVSVEATHWELNNSDLLKTSNANHCHKPPPLYEDTYSSPEHQTTSVKHSDITLTALTNGDGIKEEIDSNVEDVLSDVSIKNGPLKFSEITPLETSPGQPLDSSRNVVQPVCCRYQTCVLSSQSLPNGLFHEPVVNGHKSVLSSSMSKIVHPCNHSPCRDCVHVCNLRHVSSLPEHLACHYQNEAAGNGQCMEHLNNQLNLSQHIIYDGHQHSSAEEIHFRNGLNGQFIPGFNGECLSSLNGQCVSGLNGECLTEVINGKLLKDSSNLIYCNGKSGKPESGAARCQLAADDLRSNINSESTDTLIDELELDGGNLHSPTLLRQTKIMEMSLKQTAAIVPMNKENCTDIAEINGRTNMFSRKAKAASGASRDLSVSPRDRHGHWSDAGRLRHSSGNDLVSRRWPSSTVSTSTSDLSDSFVKKCKLVNAPPFERLASVKYHHIDIDGLTKICDEKQELLVDMTLDKERRINELTMYLKQAQNQIKKLQQLHPQNLALLEDYNIVSDSDGGELCSLGSCGNPASDASWENIEESESKMVLWVPDDAVTHCADCSCLFTISNRKHHCRNCGKIFCDPCSRNKAPVPDQHLNNPQRVCRRCYFRLSQLSPGASSDGRIPAMVADG
ncbi:myotubularin-related protein 4-like isoform X3 [Biomphalaria glabrata]|uniref:phosphatidylinositol-3,5-bisphosphate 3-phosphatase n=1 Tax=Biomphalaria glabrata TaxID=6526 RepID=A0A9W2YK97_BIOGL|nr:myotubularin-related protein 4-like isoform X3 [Biomphalaria glabrata]KAI8753635.1 myotubularin-related protein 4-like [Biomphalaria glabrata]